MRTAGGEFSLWVRRGGVGSVLGRFLEAALRRVSEGLREERVDPGARELVGDGGDVGGWDGGWDWRPSR